MSDKYVVTEDEWIRINNCLPDMAKQILERPLSVELKKEKDTDLDEFMNLMVSSRFELDGEIVVKMSDIRIVRETLRGEA